MTVHGGGTAAAGASDVRSPVLERLEGLRTQVPLLQQQQYGATGGAASASSARRSGGVGGSWMSSSPVPASPRSPSPSLYPPSPLLGRGDSETSPSAAGAGGRCSHSSTFELN